MSCSLVASFRVAELIFRSTEWERNRHPPKGRRQRRNTGIRMSEPTRMRVLAVQMQTIEYKSGRGKQLRLYELDAVAKGIGYVEAIQPDDGVVFDNPNIVLLEAGA